MPNSSKQDLQISKKEDEKEKDNEETTVPETSLTKTIENYKKIKAAHRELSEKELVILEKECKEIEKREIIESDPVHEPQEIEMKGKVTMGPPTLTRFEKARITGARALQLSLGAPPFVPIPPNARTSLDIAMIELEQKVIPISIRRVLPNGDYQNIPINYFN